jgi:hypothetical protein
VLTKIINYLVFASRGDGVLIERPCSDYGDEEGEEDSEEEDGEDGRRILMKRMGGDSKQI